MVDDPTLPAGVVVPGRGEVAVQKNQLSQTYRAEAFRRYSRLSRYVERFLFDCPQKMHAMARMSEFYFWFDKAVANGMLNQVAYGEARKETGETASEIIDQLEDVGRISAEQAQKLRGGI